MRMWTVWWETTNDMSADYGRRQCAGSFNSFAEAVKERDSIQERGDAAWIEDDDRPDDGSRDGGDWMFGDFA